MRRTTCKLQYTILGIAYLEVSPALACFWFEPGSGPCLQEPGAVDEAWDRPLPIQACP